MWKFQKVYILDHKGTTPVTTFALFLLRFSKNEHSFKLTSYAITVHNVWQMYKNVLNILKKKIIIILRQTLPTQTNFTSNYHINAQVVCHLRIYTLLNKLYGLFQCQMIFCVVQLYCRWCWGDCLFASLLVSLNWTLSERFCEGVCALL